MKIRIVKGAMKIHSKGDIVFHTFDGDMEFNAQGKNIWHGEKGNEVGKYEYIETQEDTAVTEIECVTELDDGSANDGTGVNTQKGVLYNNTYVFRVKEFSNGTPKNHRSIKWKISYTDPETNIYEDNILEDKAYRGRELRVTFTSNAHCGGNLEVKAFISDDKTEGLFPVFMHNRFRWFDREVLKKDVEERKKEPWKIDQDNTNTCGPSSIMYVFAKRDKDNYAKFILDLHRKGYSKYNNYEIDIDEDSDLENIANTNPNLTENFPKNMASCDWIPNVCITDKENNIFDFEGNTREDFSAITLPSRIEMLCKDLLGFDKIVNNTNLYYNKSNWLWGSTTGDIAELIKAKEEGYEIFLLVNMNMLYNELSNSIFSTAEHWIVLEEIVHYKPGFVKIKVYTWGQNPNSKYYIFEYNVFKTNYYGYIKTK